MSKWLSEKDVIAGTSEAYEVAIEGILSPSRRKPFVDARQAAMHILRRNGWSLLAIGSALDRHHATVMHGVKACEKRLGEDVAYAADYGLAMALCHQKSVE